MEFDTNPHHCGSHRTETPTPGTCSPVESRHKEGEGVSLQQIHPRKVQLILKSAAAVNTKAPKCFILTLLPDPQNRSPLHVLFLSLGTREPGQRGMSSVTGNTHLWGPGALLSACPSLRALEAPNVNSSHESLPLTPAAPGTPKRPVHSSKAYPVKIFSGHCQCHPSPLWLLKVPSLKLPKAGEEPQDQENDAPDPF